MYTAILDALSYRYFSTVLNSVLFSVVALSLFLAYQTGLFPNKLMKINQGAEFCRFELHFAIPAHIGSDKPRAVACL
jgi:hypothetical protein